MATHMTPHRRTNWWLWTGVTVVMLAALAYAYYGLDLFGRDTAPALPAAEQSQPSN